MKSRILTSFNLVILFICFFGFVKVKAQTSFNISNQSTGDTLFTIGNNGNVGIGTTNPGLRFDVFSIDPNISASFGLSNLDLTHYLRFYSGRMNSPNPVILWNDGDSLRFGTSLNTFTEYMRISSGGNVGIGTRTPTEILEVAGTIYSNTGGFRFPDGTVQTTAVLDGGVSGIDDLSDAINDSSSIYIGAGSGINDDGTDNANTGIGTNALNSNINGWRNTAIGIRSLYSNVSGYNNTATGMNAMDLNTTGNNNTANGSWSLHSNDDGNYNTGIGTNALYSNTSGHRNSAVGYDALRDNTTGNDNIAFGYNALPNNTIGEENTAIGQYALFRNNDGNFNTAVGYHSLAWSTSASGNSAFGYETLNANTTGYWNTALGNEAMTDNTTGYLNTAIGNRALANNTVGNGNTATGHLTLVANIDGGSNTGTGLQALWRNTSGSTNTATGNNSLGQNTTGSSNTATGVSALHGNTTGFRNVGIGTEVNFYNQEGSYNTIIGAQAGHGTAVHNKSGNVFIGYMAGYDETGDDKLYIENSNSSSPLIGGDFTADEVYLNGNVGIGTNNPLSTLSVGGDGNVDAAIYGIASNTSGTNYGGYFQANGVTGRGINAISTGSSGIGILGTCNTGRGVYGGTGSGTGVYGFANNTNGVAIKGIASHATGKGVEGDGQAYDFDAVGPGINYGSTSSKRWKTNIVEIDNPLVKINQLRGVYFDWDEEHGGGHDVGCIAEEVGKVLPEIVVYEENGVDADGMDYSKLTPLLIEAVKAQQKIIEKLEQRIEKLEKINL